MYRLFITHSWDYDDYRRVVRMLNRASDFEWQDYSVPSDRPFPRCSKRDLADALRNQIQRVHALLIVTGMEAHYREWVQKELSIAVHEFDKPVVLVRPNGVERLPAFVRDAADAEAGWSGRSIIGGIKRAIRQRRPDFAARLT